MKPYLGLGFAMLAGAVFGAAAVNGLNAQTKPGAYAVVDITEVSDPDLFKTLLPKAGPAMTAAGGQFVIRTEKITALDGAAPKRFIVIAFDSVDKAKAWNDSSAQKEVNDEVTFVHCRWRHVTAVSRPAEFHRRPLASLQGPLIS